MHGLKYIVSDDHSGLRAARKAVFPACPWQRCQFHLAQNAMQHTPNQAMRVEVAEDVRAVFNAKDIHDAESQLNRVLEEYQKTAPKLAAWAEENLTEGFIVFQLPQEHPKRLRTTNMLERQNREIKRRTRVATFFPNEAAALRLVTAVLVEISEEWETGMKYLTFTSI